MHNKKLKYIKRLLIGTITLIALSCSVVVSAESQVPYDGYTYWTEISGDNSRKSVYTKAAYEVDSTIDANELGIDQYNELSDFCVSDDGNIYILDGAASRITVLDGHYNVVKEFKSLDSNGESLQFSGAKGIYVKNGKLFICDTENSRVLVSDLNGNIENQILKPDSSLIPSDFLFRPIKIAEDSRGYTYVLSEGSFYGALLFSPDKAFIGFFGSNSVTNGVSDIFNNIMSRIFPNNVKQAAKARVLPYSIVDLCMVDDDFIYTVTGSIGRVGQKGQIRKLFVGNGSNILADNSQNFADEGYNSTSRDNKAQLQDLSSIDVDENGYIYALDSKFGRIFVYDKTGKMLSAFGGGFEYGEQKGNFQRALTLALCGDRLLVLDSIKNSITVFKPTEIFKLIKEAQTLTLNGDYNASADIWHRILSMDSNCQLAYSGIARVEYAAGRYSSAKEYARKGYDRETYALAFKELRTEFITDYFWLVMIAVIVLFTAIAILLKIKKHKNFNLIKNQKLQLVKSVLIHPIDTFTVIKEKRLSSVGISVCLLMVYYITSVLTVLAGGFMFTYYDPSNFNSIWVLLKSVGLIVLWIAANWLVCSLMGGNGRITEIITVACYSLIPLILNNIVQLILTNVLIPEEATFLSIINTVAYIFFFLMLAFGSMVIHDYGFGKFVGTSFVTVVGMAIVIFLLFLIIMLVQQLFGFVTTIITEISTL